MQVLVAYASKHGATAEIAERISETLRTHGLDVTCSPASNAAVDSIDALVFGGALYAGAWPKSAKAFVEQAEQHASNLPTWVFSSGPVGDPPQPEERPEQADALADRLAPREHRLFAGAIDRSQLSLMERGITKALRISDGDYRDWATIEEWANEIATALGNG